MVELPTVNKSRWRFRTWMLDALNAVFAFFWALFSVPRTLRDPGASAWEVIGLIVIPVGLLVASMVRAFRTRKDEMKYQPLEEPKDLRGWAKGLHLQLSAATNKSPESLGIRITVYKVIWDRGHTEPTELEQLISYVGDSGGPPGRKMSARSGIIGRVARLGEIYKAQRESDDLSAYRDELVEFWGFTEREAHDRDGERWSVLAYPLLEDDDNSPYGVVYLDAKSVNFFDDVQVEDTIVNACSLLASSLRATYNRG
jgi:hypothetical protein